MTDDDQLSADLASLRISDDGERAPAWRSRSSGSTGSARSKVSRAETGSRSQRAVDLENDAPDSSARARSGLYSVMAGLLALLLIGGGGWAVLQKKDRLFPVEVRVGQVALVSPAQEGIKLVANGYVVSRRKATIGPKIAGRVARILVREGDRVEKDQVIAELERADIDAQLAQTRSDVAAARARLARVKAEVVEAESRLRREQGLLDSGAGVAATVEDGKSRLDVARAQVVSAEADIAASESRIRAVQVSGDYTRVTAPFAGTVTRKHAEVGEVVSPAAGAGSSSSGAIVTLAALDDLEIEADVNEAQLGKVAPPGRAPGEEGTPVEIVLDAYPDKRYRGSVSSVRPTVDRAKATVVVKLRFTDPVEGVLPDMSAKISFLARTLDAAEVGQKKKRVAPAAAVVERGGRKVVFLVENGETARIAPVDVLGPVGDRVEIDERGPAVGASVVLAPTADLADGARVRVQAR